VFNGDGGGIFKSLDGGKTWRQLTKGLPSNHRAGEHRDRAERAENIVAAVRTKRLPNCNRSDDGGETWRATNRRSAAGTWNRRWRSAGGAVDPKNPQIVYSGQLVCWKSTDGGKTWDGWRGAPGGDDIKTFGSIRTKIPHHSVWFGPGRDRHCDGGKSWSSWYTSRLRQLYHVSADNTFPYRLYSGQQESGSVGIKSRGDDGEITFRDWKPVAAEEYGLRGCRSLDPDIIIGGS